MKTRFKIRNDEVRELLSGKSFNFPKYATQLLNLANQNAQGTRPNIVGQMSELIQEFSGKSITEWEKWYLEKHPDAIQTATDKIFNMIESFKSVINQIDKQMVENWVKDLVLIKTFIGLRFQEAVLKKTSSLLNTGYRFSFPEEESKGIDGIIGDIPISIKPDTYKSKILREKFGIKIIYYKKEKDGILIDISELVEE